MEFGLRSLSAHSLLRPVSARKSRPLEPPSQTSCPRGAPARRRHGWPERCARAAARPRAARRAKSPALTAGFSPPPRRTSGEERQGPATGVRRFRTAFTARSYASDATVAVAFVASPPATRPHRSASSLTARARAGRFLRVAHEAHGRPRHQVRQDRRCRGAASTAAKASSSGRRRATTPPATRSSRRPCTRLKNVGKKLAFWSSEGAL